MTGGNKRSGGTEVAEGETARPLCAWDVVVEEMRREATLGGGRGSLQEGEEDNWAGGRVWPRKRERNRSLATALCDGTLEHQLTNCGWVR